MDIDYLLAVVVCSVFPGMVNILSFKVPGCEQIHRMAAIYRLQSGSQGTGKKR